MCGVGFVLGRRDRTETIACRLRDALVHRGPDASGSVSFPLSNTPEFYAILVHTRLAILGLGEVGAQPKTDASSRAMAFNGEIYATRAGVSIQDAGIASDTMWLWQTSQRGHQSGLPPAGADGIWALIEYDAETQTLTICRDPLGVIPLYIYNKNDCLIVSSEVQAIARAVGSLDVDSGELIRSVAARQLAYARYLEDVRAVLPGERAKFLLKGNGVWSAESEILDCLADYRFESSSFGAAFDCALLKQVHADAKVGLQLSSGVDSTLIAARLAHLGWRNLPTFVARIPGQGDDESVLARANARKLGLDDPIEVDISRETYSFEILSSFGTIDPAFAHPNFFAVKRVARFANDAGIKVLLCGEGADELFRGYSRLLPSNVLDLVSPRIASMVMREIDNRRINFDWSVPRSACESMRMAFDTAYSWVDDWALRHLFANYLHELLYRQNIGGMAHSVEVRPPFLDFSVVGFAMANRRSFVSRSPRGIEMLKGTVKSHLYSVFPDYAGPRRKKGFSMPISKLLDADARELLRRAIGFSKSELGVDRTSWLAMYERGLISDIQFERHLWPALVAAGAVAAAGHTI